MATLAPPIAGNRKRLLKDEDMTKIEFETSEEVDVTPTFDTMGLREDLLRGVYAYGEEKAENEVAPERKSSELEAGGSSDELTDTNKKAAVLCQDGPPTG